VQLCQTRFRNGADAFTEKLSCSFLQTLLFAL
jgi:hypothetical protein